MDPSAYYQSAPSAAALPTGVSSASYLEIDTPASYDSTVSAQNSFTVGYLSPATKYKFMMTFTNAAGQSPVSSESVQFTTLDTAISNVEISSGAPCVYKTTPRGMTFAVAAAGTNINYRWEDFSMVGTCVSGDDCSVMTYPLTKVGRHSIYAVATNSRGTVRKEYTFTAHYCGCTDPFDANHWAVATYALPRECSVESWTDAADIVEMGTVQYYQFYYGDSTHEVELTLRVDTGKVALLVSPDGLPEVGVSTSYLASPYSTTSVSNFKVTSIPFSQLSGKRSLYIALNGVDRFSRFELLALKKDFSTSRSMLANAVLTTITTPLLTNRYNFYEFALPVAPNDIDVEITATVTTGAVKLFTSRLERYPSPLRARNGDNGYDKASVTTSAGSIATIVQTIRPDEDRRMYISVRGDASAVPAVATTASTVNVGSSPGKSTYAIKATVYRYKIESELLDLVVGVGTAGESTRYTEVSKGNFNYYEVQCNANAASVTVTVSLNFGNVQVYHSDTKLPTRDTTIGHTAKYPSTAVTWSSSTPSALTIPISFSSINRNNLKIYIGVFGLSASSYSISVAETALAGASSTPEALDYSTAYSASKSVSLTANTYYFMAIPVGEVDAAMYVRQRSGPGSRPTDLSTSSSGWGLDWYDSLTETWRREREDEHDLDVTLSLNVTTANAVQVYGSSREVYVSPERGYDVTATLAVGATTTFSIPHYTFGDQLVYVSLLSTTTQTVVFTLAKAEKVVAVSVDTVVPPNTCATLSGCSGRGSCVYDNGEETCYCVDGYTGSDCSVPEFLGSDATPANPNLVLPTIVMGKSVADGAIASAFDESVRIVFPYEVRSAPPYSKVRIRVDGKPYPDRVSGVVHIGSSGTPAEGALTYYSVNVVGLATGVNHEIQFYLVAASGRLLDVVQLQFQTKRSGGCAPDANGNPCNSKGLCQDGYCICFDGFIGTDCSTTDSTQGSAANGEAGYTSPGSSFVPTGAHKTYKTMEATNKNMKTSTANTMSLAAASSELSRLTAELTEHGLATKTKIENELDTVAAALAANKAARDVRSAALHRKLDANAAAISQDVLSSQRSKTAALEAHMETQRALYEHQNEVDSRLDSKKAAMAADLSAKLAVVNQDIAESRFRINNVLLNNGPAVKPSELKKQACTTGRFNDVDCVDATLTAAEQAGFVRESVGNDATVADDWLRGR